MDAVILESANHLEDGAIAHMGETGIAMAAEVALQNAAVLGAVEQRPPGLQFVYAFRSFFGMQFRHPPIVQIPAAAHGVGGMHASVVAVVDIRQSRGNAALRHHRVRFAKQRFADHADFDAGGGRFDGSAQPRSAARADDQHVVGETLEFRHLQKSPVMPNAHRAEADGEIRKPTQKRLAQAHRLYPAFRQLTQS